ncbi:phage minor capsid protein [Nocardia ignorata]|uniref:Minor capsid protein 2 n=1 Tax=Nocardia ignorata TaxID=145285 RepID=A0A4R6NYD7_NOCIG|nr:phage minor capsid protein [Nocardia ignorata]TDP29770.1 minor capsid protein 2 [Nocardia ignorata]
MPLTPSNGDRHAMPLVRLYKALELALWRWIAKVLGLDGFGRRWLMRILMNIPKFRAGVSKLVDDAGDRAPALVREAITRGWADGTAAARTDTGSHRSHTDDRITNRLVDRVLDALDAANSGLPAATEAVLRRAVDHTTTAETAQQHREALERSLQRDARQGFTALVDTHGRRRELVAYVEAQIRNAVSTAEIEGYTQQLATDGHDLFVVSDVPGSCETCRPFEGKVISISGSTVGAITRNTSTGNTVAVHVMCSLREALDRGLFHPNCRHTIRVWTPDNPAPPRAVRVSETRRTARRAAAAQQRANRVRQRVAVAAGRTAEVPRMARRGDSSNPQPQPGPRTPPSPFDNATTPLEVGQILQLRHGLPVEGFDLPGLSLEVVQEYARAVDDMMTRYPQMRPNRILIGPVMSPDPDRVFGEAPNRKPKGQPRTVDHVVLNYLHAGNPAVYREAMEADVADHYHSPGFEQRPVYAVIVHEFGHVLDVAGQLEGRRAADDALDAHFRTHYPRRTGESHDDFAARYDSWLRQLPGYCFDLDGNFFAREAIAEAFAEVELRGDNASEPAKVLHKLLVDKSRSAP